MRWALERLPEAPAPSVIVSTAPSGTERTYRFALRERNAWNLADHNVEEWTVPMTGSTAPTLVSRNLPGADQNPVYSPDGAMVGRSAR